MRGMVRLEVFISGNDQSFQVDSQKSYIEVRVTDDDPVGTQDVRIGIANIVANKLLENSGAFTRSPETFQSPAIKVPKISVIAESVVVQEGESRTV